MAVGAPEQLTNTIYLGEQLLPIVLETHGNVVTNAVHFMATGIGDLVAGDFGGFAQQLELIPTADIALSLFTGLLPLLGLEDLPRWCSHSAADQRPRRLSPTMPPTALR
jgi:hypothetical protein